MKYEYFSNTRRRGAPKGNTNALKHGFYSRDVHHLQLEDLEALPSFDLSAEIALLRGFIRRVLQNTQNINEPSKIPGLLRLLCLATSSLTRMIQLQPHFYTGDHGYFGAKWYQDPNSDNAKPPPQEGTLPNPTKPADN